MHFNLRFMRSYLLLVLFVLLSFIGRAEPFHPLLSRPQLDSLKRKLWQTPPNAARVDLLLELSTNLVSRYEAEATPADSAYEYGLQAQLLSNTLRLATKQVESDYAVGRYLYRIVEDSVGAAGPRLIRQAIAHSQRLHNIQLEALGWYYLGWNADDSTTGMLLSISCFEQAIRCYKTLHDQVKEGFMLQCIANVHLRHGKSILAQQELLQVLSLYKASNYSKRHYTFDLLAATNEVLGNYKQALSYGIAAIQSAKTSNDTLLIGDFYSRMARTYVALNQRNNALVYLRLGLRTAQYNHQPYIIIAVAGSIARSLIALSQPKLALNQLLSIYASCPPYDNDTRRMVYESLISCYLANKQYSLANQYSQQLIKLIKQEDYYNYNYEFKLSTNLILGTFYMEVKDYDKARYYLNRALGPSRQVGYKSKLSNIYLLLFKADSAQAHFATAIAYYQRYKAVNDSIFNEKNSREVAGLQIQYDTQKKEQSIALLTKQSLLQQMTIRQREFQRNAFIIGTALLVLVLGLGYNRYRLGQRSNRLLEEKRQLLQAQQAEISQKNQSLEQVVSEKEVLLTEKEWMLKEIHHRVKNNLQVISSLLTNQSNYLRDPLASAAIRESRNRVQAMALIHQRLYQTDTLARVNMAAYVREIVNSLLESFDRFDTVTVQLNVAAVELEIALATPLGLIVNEAVTNVLKYAFPPPGRGTLTVSLIEVAAHQYQLSIADNGVGLPPDFDLEQSHSLGLTIIKGLSTQIGGELRIESANGVRVSLQFEAAKSVVPVR
jgi:two-component sensor histidine kinase